MLQASDAIGALPGMMRELSQRMKAGAVAMYLRSLVNNNISNTIAQIVRTGDVGFVARIPERLSTWKSVYDGNTAGLSTATKLKYQALQNEPIVNGNQLNRDIGKSRLMATVEGFAPSTARALRGAEVEFMTGSPLARGAGKVGELVPRFQEALTRWYSDFGDTPFRVEEAVRVYDDAMAKVQKLLPGEWIDLPVGRERYVRVESLGNGRAELKEMSGARARAMEVDLESPQMAKVLARTANMAQEKVFFDYSRIGNLGKNLRGGPFSILSGIFSWFFKAVDLPGKKGLVSEILRQPYNYRTNSVAVEVQQSAANAQRAVRRGMLQTMGQAMLTDERKVEELARGFGYNKTSATVLFDRMKGLMPADPLGIVHRNIEPLMLSGPTQTIVGGLESLFDRFAYGDIYSNPTAMVRLLSTDNDTKTAPWVPDAERKRIDMMKKHVGRVLRNEQFNLKQFLQIIGLSGGPLLGTLQKLQAAEDGGRPFTTKDGISELVRLTFGATPSAALDVAGSVLGELGWDAGREWGGYGKDQVKQGFTSGTAQSNIEGLVAYGIRQGLGLGQLNQYAGLDAARSDATGRERYGRLDMVLDMAEKAYREKLATPALKYAEELYGAWMRDKTPEKKKAYEKADNLYKTVKVVIKREIDKYKATLQEQADKVR
jgi:hypothetical protein